MERPRAWLVTDPEAEAGALESLPEVAGLRVISRAELQREPALRFGTGDRVAVSSEAVLEDVVARLDDPARVRAVRTLKDKLAFRELLRPLFPDLAAETIPLHALPDHPFPPGRRFVVKPVKGCFGSGVRTVEAGMDLRRVADEIAAEVGRNAAILSEAVLTPDTLLVEPYIDGEEYAVDMFYGADGRPVVLNVYHHPMPANPAYLHMLYYTSAEVFRRWHAPAERFFARLRELLDVRSFPIHAEFRARGGELVPIELNPMRFGGMGLANLAHHTLGFDEYACFVEDRGPDWERVWYGAGDRAYGYVIGYNGAGVDVSSQRPDRDRFRRLFSDVRLEVPLDHTRQLTFAILYVAEDPARIPALLRTEFDDFFLPAAAGNGGRT